ncbi:MAG: hypothetical protein V9E87_06540 [Gemmatimonadales bacterium]
MRVVAVACLLLLSSACASKPAAPAADSLTRHQKDSIIGQSRLPGARGVNGALRLEDSAAARRAREQAVSADSL